MKIKLTATKARDKANKPKFLLKSILREIKARANMGEHVLTWWYCRETCTTEGLMYLSSTLTDAGFTVELPDETDDGNLIVSW